jgi:hypothetical protein
MYRGQTLRIEAVVDGVITFEGDVRPMTLGPAVRGHDAHDRLKAGDVLVVAQHAPPGEDTLVTLPCQCSCLLLSRPMVSTPP